MHESLLQQLELGRNFVKATKALLPAAHRGTAHLSTRTQGGTMPLHPPEERVSIRNTVAKQYGTLRPLLIAAVAACPSPHQRCVRLPPPVTAATCYLQLQCALSDAVVNVIVDADTAE